MQSATRAGAVFFLAWTFIDRKAPVKRGNHDPRMGSSVVARERLS